VWFNGFNGSEDNIVQSDDDKRTASRRDASETKKVVLDTERHRSTRISGSDHNHETTVFKFRDPRASRPRIYRSREGLPWAITDLAKRMNALIADGQIEGIPLAPGDIVQAAVVSYFCDGEVMRPQTTPDSPAYATLPYRIVQAPEGYWVAEPALPKESLIHFKLPETVGDLIPKLTPKQRNEAAVTLQLKEVTHVSQVALEEAARQAMPDAGVFARAEGQDAAAKSFGRFLASPPSGGGAGGGDEWREFTVLLDDVARDETPADRVKRKLSERIVRDRTDFGFKSS
jgi:hypothetical protein